MGLVPQDIVRCFHAFLEFCYIVRQDIITEDTLEKLSDALRHFHQYWQIFEDTGVQMNGFSLPRQHSLSHYILLIHIFGAPNGLCSSITESKHIKAIKEPWRRSSKFNALGQMLLTNQHLDKIAASQVDFTAHKMLTSCAVGHLHTILLDLSSNTTLNTSNDTQNVRDDNDEDENDNDDIGRDPLDPLVVEYDEAGDGVVEGPKAQSDVKLACTPHEFYVPALNQSTH